nr:MAG TPA: hypothetical protein [Caudoviricetes sp.]
MTGRLLLSNTDMGNDSSSDTTYFIRRTNEDNTETPTEIHIDAFREYDKNNKIIGDIRFVRTPTYQNTEIIARKNNADGTSVQSSIVAGITKDGIPVTTIPQQTNITGSVTAVKESFNYIAKSPSIEKGTTPTDSSKYVGYDFRDKNNGRLAWLGISYATSGAKNLQLQKLDDNLTNFTISYDTYVQKLYTLTGTNSINISRADGSYTEVQTCKTDGTRTGGFRNINYATKKNATQVYVASDDGKSIAGVISVGKTIDGDVYTECPQCSSANSILTTVSHGSGYAKLGNGIIIQSGNFTASASMKTGKVTLPLAMSTSNYRVLFTQNTAGNASYKGTAEIRSTTHGTTYFNWAAVNCSSDFNMFIDWFLIVLPS